MVNPEEIALAKQNLGTANETLRLTRERKQYGVGIVLEDIQAQPSTRRVPTTSRRWLGSTDGHPACL